MYDVTAADSIVLTYEPVPETQVVAGRPRVGSAELHELDGHSVGVWELTVGAMADVEIDEVFVVLFGAATVEFVDEGRSITLGPGSVGRLSAGQRTIWTVTETLRKVYFA
ncbi:MULTISPECIES: cupin domain-containing protein [unclassified Cryobacterium]|uniref:cupin domain-containing protein n=1 Tax=unclassified Cryobacterium TaxID=2649013 RepID=UPI00144713F5|nr:MULTISPECIES: cupin domain-containing protein [unclassified Cryobacterium]